MRYEAAALGLAVLLVPWGARACDTSIATMLDEAAALAAQLPQSDAGRKFDSEGASNAGVFGGGYRYLIHDIALQYARARCWQPARDAVALIEDKGVREFAAARVIVELARAGLFEEAATAIDALELPESLETARGGVADELITAGRLDEAFTVWRRTVLFERPGDSFFTMHAQRLATHGHEREALDFVANAGGDIGAYGDLLQVFLSKRQLALAAEVADVYKRYLGPRAPNRELAIYYATIGDRKHADLQVEQIFDPSWKAWTYFELADAAEGELAADYYRKGKNSVEWLVEKYPANHWTTLVNDIEMIVKHEGAAEARRFLEGLTLPEKLNDPPRALIVGMTHMHIAGYLTNHGSPREAVEYLDSVDHSIPEWSYIRAVAQVRAGDLAALPPDAATTRNLFKYERVAREALVTSMSKREVLAAVDAQFIGDQYAPPKGRIYETAAWLIDAADEQEADAMLASIDDPLLRARWLVGITKSRMGDVLDPMKERIPY